MKLLIRGVLYFILSTAISSATTTKDIEIYTSENSKKNITPKTIESAFTSAGFTVSANRDMNGPFLKQFKESKFDTYNLFTFYKKDLVHKLVKKYPNVGLFAPMSMAIYTKKDDTTISVSLLTPEAMAKIMKAPSDDKILHELHSLIRETLKKVMVNPTQIKPSYTVQKVKDTLVTTFSTELDSEEWESELDDFKMEFEGELAPNGFVIAGYNNLNDEFEDHEYEIFDVYQVYSICKLSVIFTISQLRPEAGAYAPCSLYLSKKKNDNNMHLAFPSVYNWISSMAIENKQDIKTLKIAQEGMEKILNTLTQ